MKGMVGGVFAFFLIAFGLTIAFGSWYTVGQDERAVLTRWGAIVQEGVEPGLHWKTPWIEAATTITVATQKTVYQEMEAYSSDQQPAHFKISVNWHVPTDKIGEVYWRYNGEQGLVDRLLDRHVPQQSKNIFGKYTALTLIRDRSVFNQDVYTALNGSLDGQPIVVESVQVEDVQFSQDYISAVKERMIAEVQVQKLKQTEEQQKVQAEITVINAEAQAKAVIAEATAKAKSIELQGLAIANALQQKGKALAENPRLVDMEIAQKWSGVLPSQMIPGAVLPLLDLTPKSVPPSNPLTGDIP